ncbi:MAG: hypothetical protein ABIU05_19430 [Nitrospirales bacterium]
MVDHEHSSYMRVFLLIEGRAEWWWHNHRLILFHSIDHRNLVHFRLVAHTNTLHPADDSALLYPLRHYDEVALPIR